MTTTILRPFLRKDPPKEALWCDIPTATQAPLVDETLDAAPVDPVDAPGGVEAFADGTHVEYFSKTNGKWRRGLNWLNFLSGCVAFHVRN